MAPATPPTAGPFYTALLHTDTRHEVMIAVSAVVHILCTALVLRLSKNSWVTAKLRKRETPEMAATLFGAYVVGFVHAIVVSVSAVLVVCYERYEIWPATVAFSIGYFVSDFIFYALPTKQLVMVIHHIVMIVGHYPTMEQPAAILYGAGDAHLIMWLSAVGYLTEISNLFLDVRWFQLKIFGQPAQITYTVNSVFLLLSYIATRVVIMPVVCWVKMVPRYDEYKAYNQMASYWVVVLGAAFISLMSLVYTFILLKPGLRAFLFFGGGKKPAKAE
ncbi:hypothetical protein T492DRAFT_895610 [Pavlovales sp. CCMP2436]|nr:hypothetical protein T492DRAFT_895610 [Pavlovales sp. CCMP2436]